MIKSNVMRPLARANALVTAAVIASATLLPAVLLQGAASGAQLQARYVDLSSTTSSGGNSTEGSGRDGGDAFGQDVTYTVGFTIATTGNVGGVVIDFCSNSPITGDACTAPTGFDVNEGTLALANQTGITDFTIDAATDANTLVLARTAASVSAATAIELDLGATGASNGITNPTDLDPITGGVQPTGTFYARILTYAATATAQAYAPATPGSFVDDGGVAMAIANELTITARVQEVLQFCIGTDTSSTLANTGADSCSNVAGTNLSLGVVESSLISKTSTIAVPNDGVALVRTNALSGAVVYYKAEMDGAVSPANGGGTLRQPGGPNCTVSSSVANVCFNSVGTTRTPIVAGTENFGMALKDLNTSSGGATTALSCDADYEGNGTDCTGAVAGNNYAWDDSGSFDTLASSSGPVDDEKVSIEFAATASPTTPTGLYSVTANFVATSTF